MAIFSDFKGKSVKEKQMLSLVQAVKLILHKLFLLSHSMTDISLRQQVENSR